MQRSRTCRCSTDAQRSTETVWSGYLNARVALKVRVALTDREDPAQGRVTRESRQVLTAPHKASQGLSGFRVSGCLQLGNGRGNGHGKNK